ncbi:cytochrome P450 [Crepidotus variabilis]|uniref:Cytochrome P450 n=1 Tax=Crepidotus variabilis TaxID=179855 RepID=A0A9P6EJY6_9AGAR|nr:cytochrome P450 [Crepidotus variabilis]
MDFDHLFPHLTAASPWLFGVVALVAAFLLFIQKRNNLPPGPKRLPLLGNAHQLPTKTPWTTFGQWAKTYGNLIHVDLFGQPIIIINSRKIASELLDKRSAVYSDRPVIPIAEITELGNSLAFLHYNNAWRKQRKMLAQELTVSGVDQFQTLMEREWRVQVKNILKNPGSIFSETKWRAGVISMRALYGYCVHNPKDPMLAVPLEGIREFSRLSTPGMSLALRYLPRWTPGVTFFKDAANYHRLHVASVKTPYDWCRKNTKSGTALMPNLCCNIMEKSSTLDEAEHNQIYNALASALGGALESNASSALTFYINMILHPNVQRKGQAEIDAVVGSSRLPNISDQPNLPYVRAILAETLRIMPPIPLCIPHALNEDDIYEGYFLPKGAWVLPNIWHMLRDPDIYPDPAIFNPDRYNGDDDAMEQVKSPVFGFGRRGCPGRLFGENSLFALLATTLATCEILPGIDEDGNEVPPSGEYTTGTIRYVDRGDGFLSSQMG